MKLQGTAEFSTHLNYYNLCNIIMKILNMDSLKTREGKIKETVTVNISTELIEKLNMEKLI